MENQSSKWKRVFLWSVIGINSMLLALFIGHTLIPIPKSVPAVVPSEDLTHQIEYVLEKVGTKQVKNVEHDIDPVLSQQATNGYWIVEHYREYEVHYNKKGRMLYKTPTSHQEYMRYWHENPVSKN